MNLRSNANKPMGYRKQAALYQMTDDNWDFFFILQTENKHHLHNKHLESNESCMFTNWSKEIYVEKCRLKLRRSFISTFFFLLFPDESWPTSSDSNIPFNDVKPHWLPEWYDVYTWSRFYNRANNKILGEVGNKCYSVYLENRAVIIERSLFESERDLW